jgi:hypothetical protein
MPTLLRHVECGSCGHRHHFCLPAGELSPGTEYEYVCPETGRRAALRPPDTGEPGAPYLQGAVELEAPARPPAGP